MGQHLVWEGVKKTGNCRIIPFVGEELGVYTVSYDDHETRGIAFRVFRTADGEILIHKYAWEYPSVALENWDSVPVTEEHWALIYVFSNLESAAGAGFDSVLINAVEEWRARRNR